MKNFSTALPFVLILLLNCCTLAYGSTTNINTASPQQNTELNLRAPAKTNTYKNIADVAYGSGVSDSASTNSAAPLLNGFAHNDYLHKHPLYDALENGFTNIEADIFLKGGKLIIAHIFPFFKGKRTLEALYLKPLAERIMRHNGKVYPGYDGPVTLLIDIKTNADRTYAALEPLLEKYRSILSGYENGVLTNRAVTIVISGHKPIALMMKERSRLAFIDGDLHKMIADSINYNVYNLASCKYSTLLQWSGNTTISTSERNMLCAFTTIAHKRGLRVRLWASPEKKAVWDELLRCGVDLINTDQLVNLKNYFAEKKSNLVSGDRLYGSISPALPL